MQRIFVVFCVYVGFCLSFSCKVQGGFQFCGCCLLLDFFPWKTISLTLCHLKFPVQPSICLFSKTPQGKALIFSFLFFPPFSCNVTIVFYLKEWQLKLQGGRRQRKRKQMFKYKRVVFLNLNFLTLDLIFNFIFLFLNLHFF